MNSSGKNPNQRTNVKIFIASSGELKEERKSFTEIFNYLAKIHTSLYIEPVLWETDIPSGSYDKPRIQDEINPLLEECQIVIVIFYSKVGAFTLEEYKLAISKKKKVFVYFKDGFSAKSLAENKEYNRVLALKEDIYNENKTIAPSYKTPEEFNKIIGQDLGLFFKDYRPASPTEYIIPKELNLIPFISPEDVIGRETELNEVKEKLDKQNSLVLVNGIGGVGKTTLAKAYVVKYLNEYNHTAWLTVSSSLKDDLLADKLLMKNLNIMEDVESRLLAKDPDNAFKLIINKLGTTGGNNLLVLDNPVMTDGGEITFIKSLIHSNWKILLTSREHIRGCFEYPLDVLTPDNAKELFIKLYQREADEKEFEDLLKEVGYHTLTVELLALTAAANPALTFKKILEYLRTHQLNNKQLAIEINAEHGGNKKIEIYAHLMSIFDLASLSEDEQHLLLMFSVLPSKEIELTLLFVLFNINEDSQSDFINILNSLSDKGYLIKGGNNYKIHPIIQEIVRYKTEHTPDDFISLISSVTNLLYVDQAKDNPVEKFPYLDFGTAIIKSVDIFEENDKATKDFFEIYNYLRTSTGNRYRDLGKYEEASELLEKALRSHIKNFGMNDPTVATIQSNLALAYIDLEKYMEAAKLLELALKSDLKNFGIDHPTVALRQSNLAAVYEKLGYYEKAAELVEQVLKSDEKNFGENHPNIARGRSNLAVVYKELGKNKEAAKLFELALRSDLKNLVSDHPTVATRQWNLARLYEDTGRFDEALKLMESSYNILLKAFGDNHPKTKMVRGALTRLSHPPAK